MNLSRLNSLTPRVQQPAAEMVLSAMKYRCHHITGLPSCRMSTT